MGGARASHAAPVHRFPTQRLARQPGEGGGGQHGVSTQGYGRALHIGQRLVVLAVLYIKHRLTRMPVGRAWEALREDEIACRSMGLNHVLVKLSAFTLGASTAGLAGVFFASYQGFVNPSSFTFFESALILAIVVLGGMGSTVGVVIAAFVLTVAPELLRSFAEYRVLLFGVLMVLMMIWRPRGLIRISRTGVTPRKGVAP